MGLTTSVLPLCERPNFTPAFFPTGAGPWKCAIVAGLDSPLKVMFQATTRVLASYVSAALPWPGVCTAGTSWVPVNGTSNNTGALRQSQRTCQGQAANGRKNTLQVGS